jgi:indole-3-glycerol phosphate synthase
LSVLDRIVAVKRTEVEAARRAVPQKDMERRAQAAAAPRAFAEAVRARKPAVIAEAKRASPSRGVLRAGFDAAAIARGYEAAGAAS